MTAGPLRRVRIGGASLLVDDDQPTFWDRVEEGRWEPATIAALGARVGPGTVFLDLGAWVGPLSLLAAARGAEVLAVEADARALAQLRRNLDANPALAGHVRVIPRAVAAEPGRVRLGARRKPGDSMSSTLLADAPGAWEVEAVTPAELDPLIDRTKRLVAKLDIEGGEYALLPALAPLLTRPDATLLLSLHPKFLAASGEVDPAGRALDALAPFRRWSSSVLDRTGPVPAAMDRATLARHDAWLLQAPRSGSLAKPGSCDPVLP